MPAAADILFIVIGLALVAGSRVFADSFRVPGEHPGFTGSMIRAAGMGDSYAARLYRWVVAVLTGLVFIAAGLADLLS